jgi:hypothetical protein
VALIPKTRARLKSMRMQPAQPKPPARRLFETPMTKDEELRLGALLSSARELAIAVSGSTFTMLRHLHNDHNLSPKDSALVCTFVMREAYAYLWGQELPKYMSDVDAQRAMNVLGEMVSVDVGVAASKVKA